MPCTAREGGSCRSGSLLAPGPATLKLLLFQQQSRTLKLLLFQQQSRFVVLFPAGLWLAVVLAVLLLPRFGEAQDIDPRRWSHLPVNSNYTGVGYAYTAGDISLDPTLKIQDGQFNVQTIGLIYIRSFELLGKSARVDLGQTYQIGHWQGLLNGVPASVNRSGFDDTSLRFAVNLIGAPPLKGKEFAAYRSANSDNETILGIGLGLQLPTGQYYSDKLINLGDNRFTIRPQIGGMHNWGKWTAELTAQTWFYTDNDKFFNGRKLQQDPLYTGDLNLIYTFRPGIWAAASIGYANGGTTSVNGVSEQNNESSIGYGFSVGLPISRDIGIKLYYLGSQTEVHTGQDMNTFAAAIAVMW